MSRTRWHPPQEAQAKHARRKSGRVLVALQGEAVVVASEQAADKSVWHDTFVLA